MPPAVDRSIMASTRHQVRSFKVMLCYLCCYAMCAYHWNTQLVSTSHHDLRQPQKSGSGTSSKAVWASNLHHQGSRLLQFLNAHAWPNHRQRCPRLRSTNTDIRDPHQSWPELPHHTSQQQLLSQLNVGWSLGPTQIPWELGPFPRHLLIFSRSADVVIATNASLCLKRTTKFGASGFGSSMLIHFGGHGSSHPRRSHPYGQGTPAGSAYSFARPQPGTAAHCGFQTATLPEPAAVSRELLLQKSENPP